MLFRPQGLLGTKEITDFKFGNKSARLNRRDDYVTVITEKLTKSFGGLTAVSNVNMNIEKGELIGLIGPNGAGKTTVFNLLTGVYVPSSGSIKLNVEGSKKEISGLKPYNITKIGLARNFQNIRLFKDLTVLDNIRIAMHQNINYKLSSGLIRTNKFYAEEERLKKEAEELLDIFKLSNKNMSWQRTSHMGNRDTWK